MALETEPVQLECRKLSFRRSSSRRLRGGIAIGRFFLQQSGEGSLVQLVPIPG